ncbi:glycosyltransferase family 2 protein [Myroides sp. LJL115]
MFSVVIPLYNKELSIFNTIESVRNQTFQDFEIIIVNDGSTDGSLKVVEAIKDSRIRIINKENGGVSSARNVGIHNAKCEWIAFLDGDDLWESNHLEEIVKMMADFPNENIYATSFSFSDGRKIKELPQIEDCFVIDNYLDYKGFYLVWSSVVVIHKECFSKVGYFNEMVSLGEDVDMWLRICSVFPLVKSKLVTACYRVDAENRSNAKKIDITKSILYHYDIPLLSRCRIHRIYKSDLRLFLYIFLRRGDFISFWKLLRRYNIKIFSI